jgi:hypothetical protein
MKKVFMLMIAIAFATVELNAQDYNWAMGVRLSDFMGGISVKKSVNTKYKIEGILAMPYWHGVILTGLYERDILAIDERFQLFCGAGGHIGNWKYKSEEINKNYYFIGVDVIAGLEYTLSSIPLSISIDYKPSFNIAEHSGFNFGGGGIAIRYTF